MGLKVQRLGSIYKKGFSVVYKKKNLKVSVPNVGTGGLIKILTVSVLYMGLKAQRLGSIYKKGFSV